MRRRLSLLLVLLALGGCSIVTDFGRFRAPRDGGGGQEAAALDGAAPDGGPAGVDAAQR